MKQNKDIKKSLERAIKLNIGEFLKNIKWKYKSSENKIVFFFPHQYYRDFFNINFLKKIKRNLQNNFNISNIELKIHDNKKETLNNFNFNSDYSFENFFYSKNNEILVNTIINIINNYITNYNPIFIYGPKGSGKTHILHAIGNYCLHNSSKHLIYLDLKKENLKNFFQLIEEFNIFILDNFDFIQDKFNVQKKIVTLINNCITKEKIIFIGSKEKISNYYKIDNNLKSLLNGGLLLNLKYPDIQSKSLFIEYFCKKFNLNIPVSKQFEISLKYKSIKEIKSLLYNILAQSELKDKKINLKRINIKNNNFKKLTPQKIIEILSKYYKISPKEITSKNKKKEVVEARQLAIYICRELFGLSTIKLGEIFNRDHSTVLYSIKKINDLKKINTDFDNMLKKLLKKCE